MKSSFYLSLTLSLLLFNTPSCGKKYYKHVDAEGIVHYSDKPPAEAIEYEAYQVRPEDTEFKVTVINRGTRSAPRFYAINPYHGAVEVSMRLPEGENIQTNPPWPANYVVPANSELFLTAITPVYQDMAWSYSYSMSAVMGDPYAVHDASHVYERPFAANDQYFISQAFGGEFSHTSDQNQHAIDIVMPEGTPVLAARGGVVMDVANDFYDGGTDANKIQRGNYVRIEHDDGSMAVYAHLQLESVVVARGQRVSAGQKIALSGSTGYASGPHLHFVVQMNGGMHLKSVPFVMRYRDGTIKEPETGPL